MSIDAPQIATGDALDNLKHAERHVVMAMGLIQQIIVVAEVPSDRASELAPVVKRLKRAILEFACCNNNMRPMPKPAGA